MLILQPLHTYPLQRGEREEEGRDQGGGEGEERRGRRDGVKEEMGGCRCSIFQPYALVELVRGVVVWSAACAI